MTEIDYGRICVAVFMGTFWAIVLADLLTSWLKSLQGKEKKEYDNDIIG